MEFGGLQKNVERGEWLTSTPGWVDRPAQREGVRRKSDGHGIGARLSGVGGGRDAFFNKGVDPQLQIMEILGEMMTAARSEILSTPLAAYGGEIYLRFHSKGYCIRSCTR